MAKKKEIEKEEEKIEELKEEEKTPKKEEKKEEEKTEEVKQEEKTEKKEEKKEKDLTINDIPGVGAATAEKLIQAGYDNLLSIAVATPGEMVDVSGVTESAARKMINFSRDELAMGFETGEEVLKKRDQVLKLRSGSPALDGLLGGGFETGAIVECFGPYGSGKTQIGHALAVHCQKEGDGMAVYIDTENTFRPERIIQMAEAIGLDSKKVLKNIRVARAFNSDHQMLLAEKVDDLIKKEKLKVKVVIVDSLTAHFRAEFIGRGTLAERQQKLNKHLHALMRLAHKHNLCIYVTNQVMARPDVFFGDPTQAIGGHIVAHACTFRVYLRRGKKGSRVAKLVDSPNLPERAIAFFIDETGVRDL